jgi:hypothetical protein
MAVCFSWFYLHEEKTRIKIKKKKTSLPSTAGRL